MSDEIRKRKKFIKNNAQILDYTSKYDIVMKLLQESSPGLKESSNKQGIYIDLDKLDCKVVDYVYEVVKQRKTNITNII